MCHTCNTNYRYWHHNFPFWQNDHGQGLNTTPLSGVRRTNHWATCLPGIPQNFGYSGFFLTHNASSQPSSFFFVAKPRSWDLARISIAASESPLTIAASLRKKNSLAPRVDAHKQNWVISTRRSTRHIPNENFKIESNYQTTILRPKEQLYLNSSGSDTKRERIFCTCQSELKWSFMGSQLYFSSQN